jgi:hypothetical protein
VTMTAELAVTLRGASCERLDLSSQEPGENASRSWEENVATYARKSRRMGPTQQW